MAKVLVLYYSSYGHIEKMAQAVAEGVRNAGAQVDIKRVRSRRTRGHHLAYAGVRQESEHGFPCAKDADDFTIEPLQGCRCHRPD